LPAEPFSDCFPGDCPHFRVSENGTVPLSDQEPTENSASPSHYQPQMILLGSMRGVPKRLPEGEIVRKPYHYGLLIRKIEELLERKGDSLAREPRPCRRCSSFAEPTKAAASS
jgi:hypothetical protein